MFRYYPDDEKRVHDALKAYLADSSATHWEVEYRLHHASSDSWVWFRERGVALRDEQGRPYRMAGSLEDVTAQRDATGSNPAAPVASSGDGPLAGGIAHDFNNIPSPHRLWRAGAARLPGAARHRCHLSAALRAKSLVDLAFSRSGTGERAGQRAIGGRRSVAGGAASLPPQVSLGVTSALVMRGARRLTQSTRW